jgi:DNA modification methylase
VTTQLQFPTPRQATSRQRNNAPIHRWFSFAEAYSPEFIDTILDQIMPVADRVLDPFGGVGTTPITVAARGLAAFYCEVNPLLQFLTETKLAVLSVPTRRREQLAQELHALTNDLVDALSHAPPDRLLAQTHIAAFGRSVFFDSQTFDTVLRLRTYIDQLTCRDPLLAALVAVGVISVLVPTSLVVRAGDLRFRRTDERRPKETNIVEALTAQMQAMADDLTAIEGVTGRAILVTENAKNLTTLPPLALNGIITSPPYLNGTNYFRNTKIELWFLRSLRSKDDLHRFRRMAITAGINDVSNGKAAMAAGFSFSPLTPILRELDHATYDRRIPLMVRLYFAEIQSVFAGARSHLVSGSRVVIDIGDSIYSGIHVPTERIIAEMLEPLGFRLESDTTLRSRRSRNGTQLRQALLTFDYSARASRVPPQPRLPAKWTQFKAGLPHRKLPYSKRNWGHPIHSLCSYAGKMKPSIAAHLIEAFVPTGGKVLDPFAGSGTIPLEGVLLGRTAYALEISSLAVALTTAKIGLPRRAQCEHILNDLEQWIAHNSPSRGEFHRVSEFGYNGRLPDYYHPKTLGEILTARAYFLARNYEDPSAALVLSCLLHILHGNRPYALSRRSHPITPFAPTGEFEYRSLMHSLRDKVERSLAAIEATPSLALGHTYYQDATTWWPSEVDGLDAIITSPPFFDSTRFHLANWIRLWFCGWEREDFEARPLSFVDELQKKSFAVYEPVFRQARERLKPGGLVVFHLGRSRKCDMAESLASVAAPWFSVRDHYVEDVTHCESHGIRDKGTVDAHQYLVLG